jgi:excisionase family DNA binding protein
MKAAVEKYYTIQEAALLLSVSTRTIERKLAAREFGAAVNLGTVDRPVYRIPASGLNAYLEQHQVSTEPGIAARSIGELRRKDAA